MRALSGCKNLKNVQLLSKLKSIGAVNADEVYGTSDVIAEFTSNQLHLRIKGERRIYD